MKRIGMGAFMDRMNKMDRMKSGEDGTDRIYRMEEDRGGMGVAAADRFVELAGPKYDEGQATHGGLLTHRDCIAEMECELIDAWHYWQGQLIKDGKDAVRPTPEEIRDRSLMRWRQLLHFNGCGADLIEGLIMKLWIAVQQERKSRKQKAESGNGEGDSRGGAEARR